MPRAPSEPGKSQLPEDSHRDSGVSRGPRPQGFVTSQVLLRQRDRAGAGRGLGENFSSDVCTSFIKAPPPPRDGQGSSGRAVGRLLERGEKRRKKWREKKKKKKKGAGGGGGGGGGSFLRILPSRLMVTRVHPLVKRLSLSGAAPAGPQMSLVTCLPSVARGKPLTYTPYLPTPQPSARGGPVCLRYLVPLSLPLRRAGRDGP